MLFWGRDLADFDALIKQALKTQNATDVKVRQKVYQSSRNALMRMLQKTGNHEKPAGKLHIAELEQAISRIESDYTPQPISHSIDPIPATSVVEPQGVEVDPTTSQQATSHHVEPSFEVNQDNHIDLDDPNVTGASNANIVSNNQAPQNDAQFETPNVANQQPAYANAEFSNAEIPANDPEPVLNYKRKSPILRRLSGLLMFLIVIGVIAWLAYALITNLSKPTDGAAQQKNQEQQKIDQSSLYLDVLTPSDSSSLVTAGRGTAEVVTQLNVDYLRIQSIRTSPNSLTSAEPILLELQPGILQKISGKSVTVEIRTKSGNSQDGLFSVQCLVSGESVCDRKRFPVGQQPENIIFALKLDKETVDGGTFLAINTDVKSTINTSGAGSPIDILYVRVRVPK